MAVLTVRHQTATFVLQDLCLHPEYIEPLRKEIDGPAYASFEKAASGLPLLDSFMKESARLTPVESSVKSQFSTSTPRSEYD